jgi:hypothetical protein
MEIVTNGMEGVNVAHISQERVVTGSILKFAFLVKRGSMDHI